jgi:TRAP-type C4-dicarboxylate transport system permease small subunit
MDSLGPIPATAARDRAAGPPAAVRAVLVAWHKTECRIAVAAFVFIALVLILDVAGRELLFPLLRWLGVPYRGATGIYGAQKMAVFALAIAAYSGLGIAAATASHLVPRVGFGAVPAAWSAAVDRLADLVTGLFLLGVAWYGVEFVRGSMATGLRAPMLQWPVWPFQAAIPLGFVSAALRYLCFARWPALRPPRPEAQE